MRKKISASLVLMIIEELLKVYHEHNAIVTNDNKVDNNGALHDNKGRFTSKGGGNKKVYKTKDITQDDLNNLEQSFESGKYGDFTDYENFIDDTLNSMRAVGNTAFIGNIPFRVVRHFANTGTNLTSALTGITDHSLLHSKRDSKENRNASLTRQELKAIPKKLHSKNTQWFYDKNNKSIVMAFIRLDNEYAKVIIRPNRKIGNGIGNEIITSGKVEKGNILKDESYIRII